MARIVDVRPLGGYQLRLSFADGRARDVDLADRLWGEALAPLRDPARFREVRVDAEFGTVVWPGDISLDPDVLAGDEAPEPPLVR